MVCIANDKEGRVPGRKIPWASFRCLFVVFRVCSLIRAKKKNARDGEKYDVHSRVRHQKLSSARVRVIFFSRNEKQTRDNNNKPFFDVARLSSSNDAAKFNIKR